MADFDLVIRNGRVATAADVVTCDIGVAGGRIVALAENLGAGEGDIDAAAKLVLPGAFPALRAAAAGPSGGFPGDVLNFPPGVRRSRPRLRHKD